MSYNIKHLLQKRVLTNLRHKVLIARDTMDQRMNLKERMQFYKVSAVSISVIKDGKIDWSEAFGTTNLDNGSKVEKDYLFQAGSISKTINAMGVLQLIDQGKLSLDRDVNSYLTSWQIEDNEFTKEEKVTVRRLLSHSAGISVHGFPGYNRNTPTPSLLQILKGEKPIVNTDKIAVINKPGERCIYSGGGTTILQAMIEDITKENYSDWMQHNILPILDMQNSTYKQPLPTSLHNKAVTGYLYDGKQVEDKWHCYPEQAAAGLWTTAEELGKFIIRFLDQLNLVANPRFISSELAKEAITPQIKGFQDDYVGLGMFINGEGRSRRFEHDGMNEGFISRFIAYPELESGFVIMVNNESAIGLIDEITSSITDIYNLPGFEAVIKNINCEFNYEHYKDFVGRYQDEDNIIEIIFIKDKLFLSESFSKMELYNEKDNIFFLKEELYSVELIKNNKKHNIAILNKGQRTIYSRI